MNSKTPNTPSRHPRGSIQLGLAVILALTPLAIKSQLEENSKVAIAQEYQSSRSQVLSRIDAAIARQDLSALHDIQSRYSAAVQDPEFNSLLNSGLAKLTARAAEMELLVSKHLDVARHMEEASFRVDPTQPQIAQENSQEVSQQLSVLPQ